MEGVPRACQFLPSIQTFKKSLRKLSDTEASKTLFWPPVSSFSPPTPTPEQLLQPIRKSRYKRKCHFYILSTGGEKAGSIRTGCRGYIVLGPGSKSGPRRQRRGPKCLTSSDLTRAHGWGSGATLYLALGPKMGPRSQRGGSQNMFAYIVQRLAVTM